MTRRRGWRKQAELGLLSAFASMALGGLAGAHAQVSRCAVIVDVSASMAGFTAPDRDDAFRGLLAALGARCAEHHTLGNELRDGPDDLTSLVFADGNTRLGESLAQWLSRSSADRVFILTDNVADSGGDTDNDQAEFYRLMKAPDSHMTQVTVMLMRLPFSGLVYGAPRERPNSYNQARALALYVVQRRSIDPGFEKETEALLKSVGLAASQASSTGVTDNVGFYAVSLLPFSSEPPRVEMHLDAADGSVKLEGGGLSIRHMSGDTDAPLDLRLTVARNPQWDLSDLPLTATIYFPQDDRFGKAVSRECKVTPATMPRGEAAFTLGVSCLAPSAVATMSAEQQRALANTRAFRSGWLEVTVNAHPRNLGLGPMLRNWSYDPPSGMAGLATPSPSVQGRIYRLGDLLAGMAPQDEVHPSVAHIPVSQKIVMIRTGPLIPVTAVLALLGLLGALAYLAAKPREIEVTGVGGRFVRKLGFGGAIPVMFADGTAATVWAIPLGFLVRARSGPVKPFVLGPRGGKVLVGRDQRVISVRLTRMEARSARRAPRRGRPNR